PLPVLAGDVELRPVQLIHTTLELSRQLQPALLVHACWVISAKHIYLDTSSADLFSNHVSGVKFPQATLKFNPFGPLFTTPLHHPYPVVHRCKALNCAI